MRRNATWENKRCRVNETGSFLSAPLPRRSRSRRSRPDQPRRRVAGSLHQAPPGDAARGRERSGRRAWVHGAAARAVHLAAREPRQSTPLQARQRPVPTLHAGRSLRTNFLTATAALAPAWVTTEAVRTQSRVLALGDSLSEFMRKLDIYSTSGRGHTRLRNQMDRLFNASVSLVYEGAARRKSVYQLARGRPYGVLVERDATG